MSDTSASVARARQLLHTAADASKKLEESVRELVAMRAWEVLGYENFSEMWEKENGYACPQFVKILAANLLMDEGMNTRRGGDFKKNGPNGLTHPEVGRAIGYSVKTTNRGSETCTPVASLQMQRSAGVPLEHQRANGAVGGTRQIIDTYGTRARSQPRRMGKAPDELVTEGFAIPRRDADAIYDIARDANVPKAEIYRQAVAEYLARHRASRPVTFSEVAS